ncbi:MAG TPA: glycosyltransferase [Streptosporangiaceae bacterium]|nr:glycosyltransferase [Streptosporangiaceae bacterium]
MSRSPLPRRALIVSADIGAGHNAAGRALEEAMARAWPGCQVSWLDALTAIGPGFGPLARAFYVSQVRHTPRMYEFFFSAMGRHRWYLESVRRGLGAWFGRRMGPRIRALDPDVIVSTYPLGSAGLSWLRRHGELAVPAGAWVPAFYPHPSWLYRDLDITFVMHPAAAAAAARSEPGLRVAVGALPVRDAFAPGDRALARAALGLEAGRFTVALCPGSLGFGRVGRAVSAVLAAGRDVQVVVACGKNEKLREELAGRRADRGRLRVLGWTGDMPGLMAAADVVVGNAGGATGLEALASGRPVIMFDPIAGHGRANAELMAASGLALLAWSPAELTRTVRRLARDPGTAAGLASLTQAQDRAAGRRREEDLADLAAMAVR